MPHVEIDATLRAGRRLDDDEISDLIVAVVDDLDRFGAGPSVGTRRVGDDVELAIGVTVDEAEELDALASALSIALSAFDAAGIGTAGSAVPSDLRSRVVHEPA